MRKIAGQVLAPIKTPALIRTRADQAVILAVAREAIQDQTPVQKAAVLAPLAAPVVMGAAARKRRRARERAR